MKFLINTNIILDFVHQHYF